MTTKGEKAEKDQKASDFTQEARRVVANAYGFVKGQESIQSFSSLTFEDAMDQQIEQISGDPGNGRLNQLDRVKKTGSELRDLATKIKQIDPKFFDTHDEDKDVNTKK